MTEKEHKNKKMGRPIIGLKKDTRVTVRLDAEMVSFLESYCEEHDLSKTDVVRLALSKLKG